MNTEKQKSSSYTQYFKNLLTDRARLKKSLLQGVLFSLCAFFLNLCPLPFDANPFGVAFLCAANKNIGFILAGLGASAFYLDSPVILICAYLATAIIRVLARALLENTPYGNESERYAGLFDENIALRMSSACIGVFIIDLYTLISGGFLFFDLYSTVISLICAPLAVLLAYGSFAELDDSSYFKQLSIGAITFGALLGASEFYIYGVSVAMLLGFTITLYIARTQNTVWTLIASSVCGLACSPVIAPAFVLGGICYHFLRKISAFFASFAAVALSLSFSVFLEGATAIITHLPTLLCAGILFAVADKLFLSQKATPHHSETDREGARDTAFSRNSAALSTKSEREIQCELALCQLQYSKERLQNMKRSLSELSAFFGEFGKRSTKPLDAEVGKICDRIFSNLCEGCKRRGVCRQNNIGLSQDDSEKICATLQTKGQISPAELPLPIKNGCERLADYSEYLNKAVKIYTNELLLSDKSEIFMLDYRGLSEMLEDFSALDEEFEINAEQTRVLRSALCREFPEIESLICYGKRQRKVMLFTSSGNELQALSHIIASRLLELTSIRFEADEDGEEETYLLFRQKAKISALHAYISLRADGEDTFCGDTVSSFEADENISFTLVSDGMGSGKDASLASQICNMFLQKTLSAGTSPLIALRQLNLFLRSRAKDAARETCATIDLLSVDAISSRAIFYKVGAAPSFIFRKSNIYKVESKTLPLGIIRELDAKKTSFELEAGDVIVMISDGALRSGGDCPFLFDIMKKCAATHSPEDLSAMIAKRAKKENGNDDISVAVIKISEN